MIGNKNTLIKWLLEQKDEIIFEIKEHKQKRSLSQNSYAWTLINQMANKLTKTKEEIYLQMLKDYGQSIIVSLLEDIQPKHFFKYYEEIGTGIVKGRVFKHYKIFKGSSEYNSLEMKYFIDGIVQECENIGIPTLTPNEIERMRLV